MTFASPDGAGRTISVRALAGCFVTTVMIAAGGHDAMAQPVRCEPAVVQLSGKVVIEDHHGPPNFGEASATDLDEKVPILELDISISILADAKNGADLDSFSDVRRIQFIGSPALKLTNLGDQSVTFVERCSKRRVASIIPMC